MIINVPILPPYTQHPLQCAQSQVRSRFAFKLVKCDLNTEICTCEVPELVACELTELAVDSRDLGSPTFS